MPCDSERFQMLKVDTQPLTQLEMSRCPGGGTKAFTSSPLSALLALLPQERPTSSYSPGVPARHGLLDQAAVSAKSRAVKTSVPLNAMLALSLSLVANARAQ